MFEVLVQAAGTTALGEGGFDFRWVNLAILLGLIGVAVFSARRHNRALRDAQAPASRRGL